MSSVLFEGNAFVYVTPSVFEPQSVRVLDPRRVELKPNSVYRVRAQSGGTTDVGPDNILHIPHPLFLGESQRAVSPIEALRQGMAIGLAADRYAAKFYENGTNLSGVIQVKGAMSLEDQNAMRDKWAERYSGVKNAHKPGILTQDAEWKPLGVTPEQAQFIEQRKFQAEEMARAYGVPPSIVGITTPGAVSYASVEQQNRSFVDYTLRPLVESIEAAYQRLIPGSTTFMKFNMNALLRGDSAARADFYAKLAGIGAMLPDEVRAKEDEPPIEGGTVPRVQLATANATAVDAKAQADAATALIGAGYTPAQAARIVGLPDPTGA
jgi:HK97 family phage portal protein